jgi:hypothetical protein
MGYTQMADYERMTALSTREVFEIAQQVFATDRIDLKRTRESHHSVSYAGGEGTVTLEAHRHGMYTAVVARTNQLRTSRLDNVVRHLLNQLPYQAGDPARGSVG